MEGNDRKTGPKLPQTNFFIAEKFVSSIAERESHLVAVPGKPRNAALGRLFGHRKVRLGAFEALLPFSSVRKSATFVEEVVHLK